MKELPATLLLAPIGVETLATADLERGRRGLLRAGRDRRRSMLVALSAVLTWLLTIRRMETLHA